LRTTFFGRAVTSNGNVPRGVSVPPTILPDTAAENKVVLLRRRGWSGGGPEPRIVRGDRMDARGPPLDESARPWAACTFRAAIE